MKVQIPSKRILFILFIAGVFIACGKSNNVSTEDEQDDNAATEHTFDISMVNKSNAAETFEYKGKFAEDDGRAMYINQTVSGMTEHSITMVLGKLEEVGSIYGLFHLNDEKRPGNQLGLVSDQTGYITIRPEGTDDLYTSIAGTLVFSDLMYALPTPALGAASFSLKFEGDFEKNPNKGESDNLFTAKGVIVIQPQSDMGKYKAP